MVTVTEVPLTRSPIMEDISGDYHLKVDFNSRNVFEITVTKISTKEKKLAELTANFFPLFGLDISDHQNILAQAEALCEEFENGIKA